MAATLAPPAPIPTPPPETPAPFQGFRSPTYTMVPDEVFDELLVQLSGAELKVLLYIIRRTFGFKRESDTISLSQMLTGIHTRDGRVLDRGVGLSKKTLLDALRSLGARRIILSQRRQSAEKGNEPTAYRLNVLRPDAAPPISTALAPLGGVSTPPLGEKLRQGGGGESAPSPWGSNSPIQDSGEQDTDPQETGHHPPSPNATAVTTMPAPTLAPTASQTREPTGAGDDDALELLVAQGVTRRIAQDLVTRHASEAIRQQLAWQRYRPPATSPAGALVRAIRDAWPPPPAWLEAQEHAAAAARQAEQEADRQREDEARRREWARKPPAERIAGRLQFWLLGQRRKGREPSEAEVAAKRAELLAELAAAPPAGPATGERGRVA